MSAVSSSSDHYVPSDYWNVKSHVQVLTEIRRALGVLLDDPLLPDVSPGVTPEEIDTKLALLRGRALTLLLRFYDDSTIRNFGVLYSYLYFYPLLHCLFFSAGSSAGLHCAGCDGSSGERSETEWECIVSCSELVSVSFYCC